MRAPIVSFEAAAVPRFEGEEYSRREIETLWAQRTLWSAIQELLASRPASAGAADPVVEFRLLAEPEGRRNRVVLNVRNVALADDTLQSLIRVLPPDYGWIPNPHGCFLSAPQMVSQTWHVARIERRLNFVDLPWRLMDTLNTNGNQAHQPQTPAGSPFSLDDAQKRSLLTEPLTRFEMERERYCLPVSGALEIDPRSLRALFQEMRAQAPCIVSISMVPIDAMRLDKYRRIAMLWGAHLRPFGAEIANAGFADADALSAQYDRFLLPDRFLCVLTMQIAAATAVAARSVALQVTARLGGLRSFKIRDPVKASLNVLGDPWSDVPHLTRWSQERWQTRRERLRGENVREGISIDNIEPLFEEFLTELPHLYSIDEAAAVAALPVADEQGLPGLDARLVAPFSDPSRAGGYQATDSNGRATSPPQGRIRIGIAAQRDPALGDESVLAGEWHTIAPRDLTKHAFVVGSTGSGKTVTTLFLVRELARLNKPFLIIEPVKTEYFDRLKGIAGLNIRRVRLEGTVEGKPAQDFLAFDPMRLQPGVSVSRHASYLKSCFESAFPLDAATALILEAGIRGYYTDASESGCKLSMFSRGSRDAHRWAKLSDKSKPTQPAWKYVVHPSLEGFQLYFLDVFLPKMVRVTVGQAKLSELYETWRQVFERRFEALKSGMIGMAAQKAKERFTKNRDDFDPFADLLSGRCILELDGIPDDEQKSLMMAFVTTFLFERRQADDLVDRERGEIPDDDLRHVLIIEEAHRILANPARAGRGDLAGAGAQAKSVSLFVDMLAEIRAFGQGLIIVEQIPTKIVPEAVKNTNLKIMLRLTAEDDREFLGSAMNFSDDQKRFVTSLRAETGRGVDMVVFEQQLDQPRLLRLPLPKASGGPIHAALFEPPIWRRA
jgi:hypothetical protein